MTGDVLVDDLASDLGGLVDRVVPGSVRPACHEAIAAGCAWRCAGRPPRPAAAWREARDAHLALHAAFRTSGISRTCCPARGLVLGVASYANPSVLFAGENQHQALVAARHAHHHLTQETRT